jgi:hypothetical protein
MIPREDVQTEAHNILTEQNTTEYKFLVENSKKMIEFLKEKAPNFWQNFGAYWFNFAGVLQNYSPREFRDYVKSVGIDIEEVDEQIKKDFDYGSDINNWIAGMEYLQQRVAMQELNGEPQEIEVNGEVKYYSPAKGFIEEETEARQ